MTGHILFQQKEIRQTLTLTAIRLVEIAFHRSWSYARGRREPHTPRKITPFAGARDEDVSFGSLGRLSTSKSMMQAEWLAAAEYNFAVESAVVVWKRARV